MNPFLNMIDQQSDIQSHAAEAAGRAARAIMQGAHVTKSDLKDELHGLENEAGVLAGVWLGLGALVTLGAIIWVVPRGALGRAK